jgi:hypothetical protein
MKFMLIMQGTQSGWESMSTWAPADIQAHIGFMKKLNAELTESGEMVTAQGLDVPKNAKIVSATQPAAPTVSDGPFAEAKEFLAGFWIVEVETPQRAIEIAALAPSAPGKGGAPLGFPIEVRQVMCEPSLEV